MTADARLRREVNDLIHPLVRHRMAAFFEANARARLAVAEVPLLLEAGWKRGQGAEDAAVVVGLRLAPELREKLMQSGRNLAPEVVAVLDSCSGRGAQTRGLRPGRGQCRQPGGIGPGRGPSAGRLRARRVAGVRRLRDRLAAFYGGRAAVEGGRDPLARQRTRGAHSGGALLHHGPQSAGLFLPAEPHAQTRTSGWP
jgi:23S rRNA pseudouridine1911/1915/1917 synthase